MNTMNDRLEQIEARSDYAMTHESLTASDYAEMAWDSARDVPYLLALVREQQARIDAALAACERIITNADGHKPPGPPNPTREQATASSIRAALTASQPETES